MRVVCKYTEKGDGIENEDAVGFADNAFWVIDGATDLLKKRYLEQLMMLHFMFES